ncbi:MAG: Xaa-Pro dipeptidase PepQ [Chloroflexota bacterium]
MIHGITPREFRSRREKLLEYVEEQGLSGYVLFDAQYVQYITGLNYLATERPVVLISSASGELAVFVPEFEAERLRHESGFERIESYKEYPGLEHPMYVLGRVLQDMGITGRVGADVDGYPGILGYSGPALGDITSNSVYSLGPLLESMMVRKSKTEVALIRESAQWCNFAHHLLHRYTREGATETEVSLKVGAEATRAMMDTLGSSYGGQQASSDGVAAGYRGQIGYRSSWAHALAHNITFRNGDVLVTESSAPVWGYKAELERTFVVGRPTDEMRQLFGHARAAQQVAFDELRPGVKCSDVDTAVLRYFEDHELLPYWKQHTGHGIGLRNHESPFLDAGDHTVIQEGMVFTVEPGVYSGQVGGFRNSDTVLITANGIDILTHFERDFDSLVIDA